MEDKLQIIELLNRYLLYVDSRDADLWVSVFTEDGAFENPPDITRGKEELKKFIIGWHESVITKSVHHFIGSMMIGVDGDAAQATSYYWAAEIQYSPAVTATGVFTDTLKKENGVWKFAHRKHAIDAGYFYNKEV